MYSAMGGTSALEQGVAWLAKRDSGFAVLATETDDEEYIIALEDVAEAKVLQQLWESDDTGPAAGPGLGISVPLPRRSVTAWYTFRSQVDCVDASSSPDTKILLDAIQAADFLEDRATLERACATVACKLFSRTDQRHSAAEQSAAHDGMVPADESLGWAAAEVLQAAPPTAATLILHTALAAAAHSTVCRSGDALESTSNLTPEAARSGIGRVLAALPPALHPLAMLAHQPDIQRTRMLSVADCTLQDLAAIVPAATLACGAHLTALSLDLRWMRTDVGEHAPPNRLAPIHTMTALRSLQITRSAASAGMQPACAEELQSLLPSLRHLTKLHMHGMHLLAQGAVQVIRALAEPQTLRVLCLPCCEIMHYHGAGTSFSDLADALRTLRMLSHLCLSENDLYGVGWDALALAVAALPLQVLELQDCSLGGLSVLSGAEASSPLPQLRCLDLRGNYLFMPGTGMVLHPRLQSLLMGRVSFSMPDLSALLSDLLQSESSCMRVMHLSIYPGVSGIWGQCIAAWRNLTALRLHFDPNEADTTNFLPSIATLGSLRDLDVGNMRVLIRHGDSPDVCGALRQLTALTSLTLGLTACMRGWEELANGIGALTRLQSLQLRVVGGRNAAECDGGILCAHMHGHRMLHTLKLVRVPLGDPAARELAKSLACMTGMRELVLMSVGVGEAGAKELASALCVLSALSVLDLSRNPLGARGVEAVEAVLAVLPRMRALRALGLGGCAQGEAAQRAVLDAVPAWVHTVAL